MGCAPTQRQAQQPLSSAASFRRARTLEDPESDSIYQASEGASNSERDGPSQQTSYHSESKPKESPSESKPKLARKATADSLASSVHTSTSAISSISSASNPSTLRDSVQKFTMKSTKDRPNQDSHCVVECNGFFVYGVFDGHGKSGHRVSKFVRDHLPGIVLQGGRLGSMAMPELMRDAFAQMATLVQEAAKAGRLEAERSGCTATIILHDQQANRLTVSYVGDSGAAIAKAKGKGLKAQYLTPDHKPNVPGERKRILKSACGGVMYDGSSSRVYKKGAHGVKLNMSRSFGDLELREAGVISAPSTYQVKLTRKDRFLVLCSDGVWEFMSATEAVECVQEALKTCADGAKALAREATDRWVDHPEVDDITAVVILLQQEGDQPKRQTSQGSQASSADTSSAGSSCSDDGSRVHSQGRSEEVKKGGVKKGGVKKWLPQKQNSMDRSSSDGGRSDSTATGGAPPLTTLKGPSSAILHRSDSESSIMSSGPLHATPCLECSAPTQPMKRYFVSEKRMG